MKVDRPMRMALLILVAVLVWVFNLFQFQQLKSDEEHLEKGQTSWDLNMDERLKILSKQKVPDLPDITINPFFPTINPQKAVPKPKTPVKQKPKEPAFNIQWVGSIQGDEQVTILLKSGQALSYLHMGDSLGEWKLEEVSKDKIKFSSGEAEKVLER